jgi:hypothetical protein
VPALGATKVFDVPGAMSPVSNDLSSAATVCVVVSVFITVTVDPACTVIGAPNMKFLTVIVFDAVDPLVVFDADFELELQAAPANATRTATEHTAIRLRRFTIDTSVQDAPLDAAIRGSSVGSCPTPRSPSLAIA